MEATLTGRSIFERCLGIPLNNQSLICLIEFGGDQYLSVRRLSETNRTDDLIKRSRLFELLGFNLKNPTEKPSLTLYEVSKECEEELQLLSKVIVKKFHEHTSVQLLSTTTYLFYRQEFIKAVADQENEYQRIYSRFKSSEITASQISKDFSNTKIELSNDTKNTKKNSKKSSFFRAKVSSKSIRPQNYDNLQLNQAQKLWDVTHGYNRSAEIAAEIKKECYKNKISLEGLEGKGAIASIVEKQACVAMKPSSSDNLMTLAQDYLRQLEHTSIIKIENELLGLYGLSAPNLGGNDLLKSATHLESLICHFCTHFFPDQPEFTFQVLDEFMESLREIVPKIRINQQTEDKELEQNLGIAYQNFLEKVYFKIAPKHPQLTEKLKIFLKSMTQESCKNPALAVSNALTGGKNNIGTKFQGRTLQYSFDASTLSLRSTQRIYCFEKTPSQTKDTPSRNNQESPSCEIDILNYLNYNFSSDAGWDSTVSINATSSKAITIQLNATETKVDYFPTDPNMLHYIKSTLQECGFGVVLKINKI